jgi:hypothetical protein
MLTLPFGGFLRLVAAQRSDEGAPRRRLLRLAAAAPALKGRRSRTASRRPDPCRRPRRHPLPDSQPCRPVQPGCSRRRSRRPVDAAMPRPLQPTAAASSRPDRDRARGTGPGQAAAAAGTTMTHPPPVTARRASRARRGGTAGCANGEGALAGKAPSVKQPARHGSGRATPVHPMSGRGRRLDLCAGRDLRFLPRSHFR